MINGYLKIMVLQELADNDQTGYSLINCLSEKLGRKPSAGSMYPLLNDLYDNKYIRLKEDGRKKIYSISPKGKKHIDFLLKEKEVLMNKHVEICNILNSIEGTSELPFSDMVERIEKKKNRILRNHDIVIDLRDTILKMFLDDDFNRNEDKIRKIISETTRKIKRLMK